MKHVTLSLFALLFTICIAQAQHADTDERKLKLAESYEKSGDNESAMRIYQDLYQRNPNSGVYFQGVKRCMLALNRFADLLPIVEEQTRTRQSPDMYALYGHLLWKTGKTDAAGAAWQKGIAMDPINKDTYTTIAQAQMDNRLFDLAISTLLQGREAINRPAAFSNELSQLYAAVNRYEEGVKEVITLLQQTGNLSVAEGRLSAFLVNVNGIEAAQMVLDAAYIKNDSDVAFLQLYEWFLRHVKDYETALALYERIDELTGADGRHLLTFGNLARKEGYHDVAIKAYSKVIALGDKRNPNVNSALFGYASTMELRLQSGHKFTPEELEEVVERYKRIVRDYPNTGHAAESQFRLAGIAYKYYKDVDLAIEEYERLINEQNKHEIAAEGGVMLGRLYLEQNEIDKAAETFRQVMKKFRRYNNPSDEAEFQLAELDFYAGRLDSARDRYTTLSVNAEANIANDALSRLALLNEAGKDGAEALKVFAGGLLRERQEHYEKARASFESVISMAPQSPLAELAQYRIGFMELNRGNYEEARTGFNKLMELYPETIYGDQTQMHIGDSFLQQNRVNDAIEAYTVILVKYPGSTLLQEARAKIRKLRGDT